MPNAAEIIINLVDKIAPDFVIECVKATGRPEKLSIYPRLLERWREEKNFDALAKLGTKEAVDILIEALKDEDFWMRRKAVYALSKIGEQAIPYLIPLLKDNTQIYVRKLSMP